MKLSVRLLSFIFLVALTSVFAKAQTPATSELQPETIVHTPLNKNDQWHNLKRWVALTFDNSSVIDMEDAERGTMVIKWSCPIAMPSDFVGASAVMTYVIDVRDGKYRIQRLNPRIIYQLSRPDIYDDFDNDRVNSATADIRLITNVSRQLFDGALEWPVNEKYADLAQAYSNEAGSTPQYRNDRDRERGKINDDWRRAERNWRLINKPRLTLLQLDASMSSSLDSALRHNDDF